MLLNSAGELLMQHIRAQRTDLQRVQSQVADLSGVRRGHVSIACSQALLPYFLPEQISGYRAEHPGVTFSINIRDRAQAEQDLASITSDLALVFELIHLVDFEVLFALPQNVQAVSEMTRRWRRNRICGCVTASAKSLFCRPGSMVSGIYWNWAQSAKASRLMPISKRNHLN